MSLASSIKTANYIIFTFVTVMKSGPNITPWTPVILNRLLKKKMKTALIFAVCTNEKKKKFKKKCEYRIPHFLSIFIYGYTCNYQRDIFQHTECMQCITFSLRKHPFFLALRRWGRFARRNVCDSATEIPYWWRKICLKSGQKRWLVDRVVILF